MSADRILIDLGVIGQLKGSDKLGVLNMPGEQLLIVDSGSSWLQGLYRWYQGTYRAGVLDYLWKLVGSCEKCCELIAQPLSDRHKSLQAALDSAIEGAVKGLENLRTTYSNDSNTVSQLTLIIRKFEQAHDAVQATPSTRQS